MRPHVRPRAVRGSARGQLAGDPGCDALQGLDATGPERRGHGTVLLRAEEEREVPKALGERVELADLRRPRVKRVRRAGGRPGSGCAAGPVRVDLTSFDSSPRSSTPSAGTTSPVASFTTPTRRPAASSARAAAARSATEIARETARKRTKEGAFIGGCPREPCQSDRAEAKAIGWNPDCGRLSHGRGGVTC